VDFKPALKKGKLLKRYKRFFADIEHKGEVLTAHVPNTGSLKTVPLSDADCYFSTSDDPKRKLKYTLEFIKTPTGLAGANTRTPNAIVHEALLEGLKGNFDFVQPELKISDSSRIDFVLWSWLGEQKDCPKKLKYPDFLKNKKLKLHFVEVKNVNMVDGNTALFPDGVTERGRKHLDELAALSKKKFSTEILFTVQREQITQFSIAKDIDPKYYEAFQKALKAKVKATAYTVSMDKKKVFLNTENPLKIAL